MVHMFRCADLNLLLDVESGALHVLSDEAAATAPLYLAGIKAEEITAQLQSIPCGDVLECIRELDDLKASGLLDTEPADESAVDDGGIVKALCLHVAHDCNLRCGYCFASTGDFEGQRSLMTAEVGCRALDFLILNSGTRRNLEVDFFGGEPMMNFPVVQEIVRYGRELEKKHGKEIHFTLTTNCFEVPQEAIEFCNQQMHNLVLSIDGRQQTHDALRPATGGKPSYARALSNAKALIEKRGDGEYYARGTFTRKNLDFVPDVESLWDEGFQHVSVEPVVLSLDHPLSLREEDLSEIILCYDRLLQAVLRRKAQGKPHHFFHFTLDLSYGPCLRKRLSGCGAGREYLAVTPDGTLYPCHQFVGRQGYAIGSVKDGILNDAVRNEFLNNHIGCKPSCDACFAKYFCSGGCAANAQAFSGSILTPNPLECAILKKRTECALALAAMEQMDQE